MSLQAVDRLPREFLLRDVQDALGASAGERERGTGVGVEVEVIPVMEDGSRLPMTAPPGAASGVTLLADVAGREGWETASGPCDTPAFKVPAVGLLTFEPGGQVELSTRVYPQVDEMVADVHRVLRPLFRAGEDLGVRFVFRGMDPAGRDGAGGLQILGERYRRQLAHYASVGPWGRRMMLDSAALHINLDLGGRPVRRWSVANRSAASFIALFANSSRYGSQETHHRSYRAHQWRHLDPSRTGVVDDDVDPAGQYLAFALEARHFLGASEGDPALPFRAHWEAGADREEWRRHLTTLFPEVRPRGYLELRSVDALRPAWLAAPVTLAMGLLYDPAALEEARRVLPASTSEALTRAGAAGLADPAVAGPAGDLAEIALSGARALGEDHVGGAALDVTEAFLTRFTREGRDPASEPEVPDPFAV